MEERTTLAKCVVCSGLIVQKFVEEYDPTTGPPIIGPGSKKQFRTVSKGYYCKGCGIKYEHLPKK
jgi:hypothetical protein